MSHTISGELDSTFYPVCLFSFQKNGIRGASVNAEINIEVLQDLLAGEACTAISIDLTREMVASTLMSMSADKYVVGKFVAADV